MALSLQLGYPDVPKSVTNPNVSSTNALDVSNPMPLTTFIKIINISFDPESLQNYYNEYLRSWNNKNSTKIGDEEALIVQSYRDFIKDVSLNYTTPEEKKFLSKIDFNDPFDLDVALGFYGKKLKELSLYYNNKRDDVKFNVTRNKIRGTNTGVSKLLFELTTSYLKNLEDGQMIYNYGTIKNHLEVEIEELYDMYPLYFNQEYEPWVYDKKDLDYGYDIFLKGNDELVTKIFSTDSDFVKEIKEVSQLFDNRRKLTERNIATNYYYLSTGSTTSLYVTGELFEADNNVLNFLNRNYPTTASTENVDHYQSSRLKGFFKPSKTSILLVDGANSSFSFNVDALEPNKLYYFPDPNLIGTNNNILTFVVDDSGLKRNYSSGNAANQPKTSQHDTKYYGYVSKIEYGRSKYLDSIFEQGFIADIKSDVYGNLFGLFKDDAGRPTVDIVEEDLIFNLIINGYKIYDDLYKEGYSFDYFIEDYITFDETRRSGLSTNTGGFLSNDFDFTFDFGFIFPYNEHISPTDANLVTTFDIKECAFVVDSNGVPFDETYSTDLSAFELSSGVYYFDFVYEGGITNTNPIVRALVDPDFPSLTANILDYVPLSNIILVDGGGIGGPYDVDVNISQLDNSLLPIDPLRTTQYTIESLPYDENYALSGKIIVRNSQTREIKTFLESFPYISTKYSAPILDQIDTQVYKIDISYDTLFIETFNYLAISKIKLENGVFVDPKSSNFTITHNISAFDRVSNRFKIGNDVYYCTINATSDSLSNNDFSLLPEIYKFDLLNYKNDKIYPINTENVDNLAFFSVSGGNIRYITADSPVLVHSSRNNIFSISILLKDQSEFPSLHVFDFEINPDVNFLKHDIVKFDDTSESNILNDDNTLNIFLSSDNLNYFGEELIV